MSESTDLDRRAAARARRQHGLITRTQALELGYSPSTIAYRHQQGRWAKVANAVYLIGGAPYTWHTNVLAACFATDGVASHRTAAVLHEVPGFRPGHPEVTVARGRRPRSGLARIHQSVDFDRADILAVDGIPTTSPARLAVDLGGVTSFPTYTRAIDDLLGRHLVTWDVLLGILVSHAARGRNGVGALRALLDERYGDATAESALERLFQKLVRDYGLPEPEDQVTIFDRQGFIARVDFAYPERKIAIELDSVKHHLHDVAFEEDPRKRNRLKLAGWLVLEFTWKMLIDHPGRVAAEVREAIATRSPVAPAQTLHEIETPRRPL